MLGRAAKLFWPGKNFGPGAGKFGGEQTFFEGGLGGGQHKITNIQV